MNFTTWINTLVSEKGIDTKRTFEVQGASGTNFMSYEIVLNAMIQASKAERAAIKNMIVMIDFKNGDVCHYLRHLAQAIAR